jgi:hypothetical protein
MESIMHRGYIAIWRKIQDHRFYRERRVYSKFEAWFDLLMEAQHREYPLQVILGMGVLIQNYGETLKSMRTWGIRWGWSRSKVKRFLNLLQNMNQIVYKNEPPTTRITILNYDKYDPKKIKGEPQSDQDRAAPEPQSNINNNDKNAKNVIDTPNGVSVPDKSETTGKVTILDHPPSRCPHQDIINLYHLILPELPHIQEWDEAAKGWLRARWRSKPERQNLEWWQMYFEWVKKSGWLMGHVRHWSADLRWLVKSSNFAKVINGNYHQKTKFKAEWDFIHGRKNDEG